MTKDDYVKFINDPKHMINPPRDIRMFDSDFLEAFSKTSWYIIPLFWSPVILYLTSSANATNTEIAITWTIGFFLWELVEYLLHRFVFHCEDALPDNGAALFAHFMAHGIHHAFPMDRYRLVFPIVPGYSLGIMLYSVYWLLFPSAYVRLLFAGTLIGYIQYDLTHYYLHHSRPHFARFRELKTYHMLHHYRDPLNGYGITSKVFDKLFGTLLDTSMMTSDKKKQS